MATSRPADKGHRYGTTLEKLKWLRAQMVDAHDEGRGTHPVPCRTLQAWQDVLVESVQEIRDMRAGLMKLGLLDGE